MRSSVILCVIALASLVRCEETKLVDNRTKEEREQEERNRVEDYWQMCQESRGRCARKSNEECLEWINHIGQCEESRHKTGCCIKWAKPTCVEKHGGVCVARLDFTCRKTAPLDDPRYKEPHLCPDRDASVCCVDKLDPTPSRPLGCGETESRVSESTSITAGTWPWMVSVRSDRQSLCSGVLLDTRHILTAAACVSKSMIRRPWGYGLDVGDVNPYLPDGGEQVIRIARYLVRPDHSLEEPWSGVDLAVIRLREPLSLNRLVNPVCLPGGDQAGPGGDCWFLGYGSRDGGSPRLNQVAGSLTHCGHDLCFSADKLPCGADLGGPVVCHDGEKFTLRGLVTSLESVTSCASGQVSVTDVERHADWLEERMKAPARSRSEPPVQQTFLVGF